MNLSIHSEVLDKAKESSCCSSLKDQKSIAHCYHCGQPISEFSTLSLELDGQKVSFCCHGCQSAAQFIHDQKLEEFYQEREGNPTGASMFGSKVASFDASSWGASSRAGRHEVTVELQGVYCVSCTNLIAKALKALPFEIETEFKSSGKILSLSWDGDLNLAQQAIETIDSLGYRATPLGRSAKETERFRSAQQHQYLKWLIVAGLGTMQVMTYSTAHYLGATTADDIGRFLELISMMVASIVVLYAGQLFFSNAWRDLKQFHVGMDVTVALAIGSAFFMSAYQTLFEIDGRVLYYDSAVMFVFFLLMGRYLEARARSQFIETDEAILQSLPEFVAVDRRVERTGKPGVEQKASTIFESVEVRPTDIMVNDRCRIKAGDSVPCDCIVEQGSAEVDEANITGESTSRFIGQRDSLCAASKITRGEVSVRCTKAWSDSSLAKIEELVVDEYQPQAVHDRLMQTFGNYFIAAVLIVTLGVAGVWMLLDPSRTFEIVLAMLIATCPCAFALAAPIGHTAAINRLRSLGVLVSNPEALALITKSNHWWFDKTGTITQGKTSLVSCEILANQDKDFCLDLVASIESLSGHPIANAFLARHNRFELVNFEELPGKGLSAMLGSERYYVGKLAWINSVVGTESSALQLQGDNKVTTDGTIFYLSDSTRLLARFVVKDEPRKGVVDLFKWLCNQGIRSSIVTGDRQANVESQLQGLTIDQQFSEQSPSNKQDLLKEAKQQGDTTVMVGDGANDAPILAAADVAIVLSNGHELSQAQADIVILNQDMTVLRKLVAIAQLARRISTQNSVWAIAYNITVLPLAALGLLTPWIAALGMSFSSLFVVLNASRIRGCVC